MSFAVRCPRCQAVHTFADELLGQPVTCRQCQQRFRYPEPAAAPPPLPADVGVLPDRPWPPVPLSKIGADVKKAPRPALGWMLLVVAAGSLLVGSAAVSVVLLLGRPTPQAVAAAEEEPPEPPPPVPPRTQPRSAATAPRVETPPDPPPSAKRPGIWLSGLPELPEFPSIKAAALRDQSYAIKLPEPVVDVAVGGGRYLLLLLKGRGELAVFDTSTAQVVHRLQTRPIQHMTAGMERVVLVTENGLERRELPTLRLEATAPLPGRGTVRALRMGSASAGPVLIGISFGEKWHVRWTLLDLKTLKPLAVTGDVEGQPLDLGPAAAIASVSADGTIFGLAPDEGKAPTQTLVLQGEELVRYDAAADALFFTGRPHYANEIKGFQTVAKDKPVHVSTTVPAPDGYRLRWTWDGWHNPVEVVHDAFSTPLAAFQNVDDDFGPDRKDAPLPPYLRQHLFLRAGLIVVIPPPGNRLIFQPCPQEPGLLRKKEYLFVQSQPPLHAERNRTYFYDVKVAASAGDVKYSIELSPDGVSISPTGRLTWLVPETAATESRITVVIRDGDNRQVRHTFHVRHPGK